MSAPVVVVAGRELTACTRCGLALPGVYYGYQIVGGTYDAECLVCSGTLRDEHGHATTAGHYRPLRWLGAPCVLSRRELDRLTVIGLGRDMHRVTLQQWIGHLNAQRLAGAHVII